LILAFKVDPNILDMDFKKVQTICTKK